MQRSESFEAGLERVRGMVEVLDHMGTDLTLVDAARESFHKQSQFVVEADGSQRLAKADAKLIQYLARNGHWTPAGNTAVTFRIKMPIYVARQWRTSSIGFVFNEVSRRYVDEPPEFEFDVPWRKRPDKSVKQGSGEEFDEAFQEKYDAAYMEFIRRAEHIYNDFIDGGVAPEQARKVLPVSHYTEFWQTGSLESFARLYKLRTDSHAQQETQQYAVVIGEHMARLFPEAWPIWVHNFKGEEIDSLKSRVAELEAELNQVRANAAASSFQLAKALSA